MDEQTPVTPVEQPQQPEQEPVTTVEQPEAQEEAVGQADSTKPKEGEQAPITPREDLKAKKPVKIIAIAGAVVAVIAIVAVLFGTHTICIHSWKDATCKKPKTCEICGKTEGESLGHAPGDWRVEKEATCAEKGRRTSVCSTCGEIVREDIPTVEHTEGEWTVTKKATMGSSGPVAGEKSLKCSVCGEVLKTESYTLTAEEIEAEFKGSCAQYTYEEVFRNPDNYKGKNAVFRGEVIQVLEEDGEYTLRVNVTEGRYIWEDTILVSYTAEPGASRILEDDIVTLYGTMKGVYTYESVMGADITVPLMLAEYIEY